MERYLAPATLLLLAAVLVLLWHRPMRRAPIAPLAVATVATVAPTIAAPAMPAPVVLPAPSAQAPACPLALAAATGANTQTKRPTVARAPRATTPRY